MNEEKYISKRMEETLSLLPKEVIEYTNYLRTTQNISSDKLAIIIDNLMIYYNHLYLCLKKIINSITPSEIESLGAVFHKDLIQKLTQNQKYSIVNYLTYLIKTKNLSESVITSIIDLPLDIIQNKEYKQHKVEDIDCGLKGSKRFRQIIIYNDLEKLSSELNVSQRYINVLNGVIEGKTNSEIARSEGISPSRVASMLFQYTMWCKKYTQLEYFTNSPPIPINKQI